MSEWLAYDIRYLTGPRNINNKNEKHRNKFLFQEEPKETYSIMK